jgi:hypothetical protein
MAKKNNFFRSLGKSLAKSAAQSAGRAITSSLSKTINSKIAALGKPKSSQLTGIKVTGKRSK